MPILIAESARISAWADIEDSVRGSRIVVGDNSVIDSFVKIKPVGGSGDLVIGENVFINSYLKRYKHTYKIKNKIDE